MYDPMTKARMIIAKAAYLRAKIDQEQIKEQEKWGRLWLIAVAWGAAAFGMMLIALQKYL